MQISRPVSSEHALEIDLQKHLVETTRGQIVNVLRRGAATVDRIASELQLSHNAVRVQLTRMERDGLVRRAGIERRSTRPSHVFELTTATQQLLSRAYVPFFSHVVRVLGAGRSGGEFERVLRDAGKSLAKDYRRGVIPASSLAERVRVASDLLNSEFGALTDVERVDGRFFIRGHGCPLAAITGDVPAVCLAMETFVREVVGAQAKQCCTLHHPPQCCFEVLADLPRKTRKRP